MIINDLFNNNKFVTESQLNPGEDPYYFRVRQQTKRDIELEITMPRAWDAVGPEYATYEEAQAALKALQAKYPNGRFTYTQHPRISNMGGTPHRVFPPGVEEAKKKKKSSRPMGGYFFPGYGYYGNGESGESGGDGGGESTDRGMVEDDDAVAAFLARGGQVQKLKPAKPRKGERWQGSSHIGAAGGRGTKGRVSGLAANTGKSGKPVVTAEQGVAEANNDTGIKWFDFATWVLKQGNKYKDFTTNHTVHQAAQKEYKAYVNSRKQGVSEVSLGDYGKKAMMSRAMAQTNRFFDRDDAAKVAAADRTIANRTKGLASADARVKPYTPPAQDAEKQQRDLTAKYPNIDELVRRAELNRDPNYERADGQAYYAARDAEQNYLKLKQIQRVIQGLNESLNQSHLP